MEIKTILITRNDSKVNWDLNPDIILKKGEMAIEFAADGTPSIKIGDGVSTWAELPYFGQKSTTSYFEATLGEDQTHEEAIAAVVGEQEVSHGSVAVVKKLISGDKYEYTAYVYIDGWKAMDGNYSAENVYFNEDFTFTKAVGTVTIPSTGSTVKAAAGKNIKEFLASLFAQEVNPTKTDPNITVTVTTAGNYEVGDTVSLSYDSTFTAGKYTYGPATGVTVTSYEVTDSEGNTADTADGTFSEITVEDDTEYSITVKVNYTDGAMPKTNIGNDYPAAQIKAGSDSATATSAIKGYRAFFYGVLDTTTVDVPLTSAIIRESLTNAGEYIDDNKSFTLNGSATAKRMVIAIPSSLNGSVSEVILTSAMNTPVTDMYIKTEKAVKVEGLNGATAVDYDVWVYEPSTIDAGEVHAIKLG